MTPDQYCQDKAAGSGSSFYYSFMFLPAAKRRAITALYAFCREVDDVADECTDAAVAGTKLAWWRAEVERVFAGNPQHPVGEALAPVVRQFDLAPEQFYEVIDGMEMDLTQNRYPDFKALNLYCYRVAAVVGEMSAAIFGYRDRRTQKYAYELGIAFQLTNIIRDVGEDARRNRIYLPLEDLEQFQVREAEILNAQDSENFRQLMAFQIQRARHHYAQAFAALPAVDRKDQRAGLLMAAIYGALLDEIERDPGKVLTHRTSLTPLRKLWIAWKTWIRG